MITATFAADIFFLRDDWMKRETTMLEDDGSFNLLSLVSAVDFLSSMTLLAQVKRKRTLTVKRKNALAP